MHAFIIFISVKVIQDFDYNVSYLMEISINLYLMRKGSLNQLINSLLFILSLELKMNQDED